MNQDRKPVYTDEVQKALRQAGKLPAEPVRPPVPTGHVQYLVAVGETVNEGVAPPSVVAAILRAAADQLDPRKPVFRNSLNAGPPPPITRSTST